jgi:eukaryotic-like serine/threonine-protein kinase
MLDQEEIDQQLKLLEAHRRTLAHSLEQYNALGVLTPPALVHSIREAWTNIAQIKTTLRVSAVEVADDPLDEPRELHITVPTLTPTERRNRQRMLQKVRDFWIKGVLENSLHGAALIELGMEYTPDAVQHPWDMVVQRADQTRRSIEPGTRIVDVFDELGGELLILGEPGSGKTTMLLELLRDLITRVEQDETIPVPVIFNLSAWNNNPKPLAVWLVDELNARYDVPRMIGQVWIDSETVLPMLDGLDEVRLEERGMCVEMINAFRRDHGLVNLVVCSRVSDYQVLQVKLKLQGAILLQPLTTKQIDSYLAGTHAQLASLQKAITNNAALQELSASPLMLSILVLAYQGVTIEPLPKLTSLDELRTRLFNAYVERMFKRRGVETTYTPARTRHYLSQLARMLSQHTQAVFFIEHLQPTWLQTVLQRQFYVLIVGVMVWLTIGLSAGLGASLPIPSSYRVAGVIGASIGSAFAFVVWIAIRRAFGLTGMLMSGMAFGTAFGLTFGLIYGTGVGWVVGVAMGGVIGIAYGVCSRWLAHSIAVRLDNIEVIETLTWSWSQAVPGVFTGLSTGLAFGLVIWLILGQFFPLGLIYEVVFASGFGVAAALSFGLLSGLRGREIEMKMMPNQGIWRSLRSAVRVGVAVWLFVGLPIGLTSATAWRLFYLPEGATRTGLITGLGLGLAFGLAIALFFGGLACVQHFVLRVLLYQSRAIPWNYVRFLDYCAERIFLRKVGGGYIFVHRMLMEYFASLDTTQPPEQPSAQPE